MRSYYCYYYVMSYCLSYYESWMMSLIHVSLKMSYYGYYHSIHCSCLKKKRSYHYYVQNCSYLMSYCYLQNCSY